MGLQREFTVALPDGYDPGMAYPLVFALHGRGSNGEQFRLYAGVEEASAGQAIFVYPDGLPVESMAGQTGWELGANDRDVAFFDALYDELTTNLCVDLDRVYATGHSFGGFFSNALGCVRGDVLRAIAPVAGGGPAGVCQGQVAVWIAHGEDDMVVDTFLGQMTYNTWVSKNACDAETEPVDPEPCIANLGCDAGFDVVWCLHAEQTMGIGTHGWPSFAGDAIWAFFAAH
jgi:poly(3-hydroxybutyrate) depolymerase